MTATPQLETYRGVVYPAQCDAMGHMNVQHYIAAFDQAMWHMMHELGYRTPADSGVGYGWADVRHVVDFRTELRPGDLYKVSSGVRKIGGTSLITLHRLFKLRTGELAAECDMTSVYFDLAARASCPLPQAVRDAARACLQAAS